MKKIIKKEIEYPKVCLIEGVLMPNKEFIHYGKSLGFINEKQSNLVENEATKLTRGNEVIIALGKNIA